MSRAVARSREHVGRTQQQRRSRSRGHTGARRARPLHASAWTVLPLLLLAACGVREIDHAATAVDTSRDFGPARPLASGGTGAGAATAIAPISASNAGTAAPAVSIPIAGGGASPISTPLASAGVSGGTTSQPIAGVAAPAPVVATAPPALSGVTIDLGGTTVAKEDAIAFIHFGHSNMAGRAIGPQATRPYFFTELHPRAWMYHAGKPPEPAHEPNTAGDNSGPQFGGPGTALIKQAADLAPSKHFISLGFGKTSAYCSQFLPGSLYYDSVMQAAKAIKDRVTFGAIVVLLGITERHGTAADISGYSSCINKLVTAVRTDVGRPDLPLLINDYEAEATGELAITSAYAQSILPEIRKIPEVVSNSALVATDKLPMEDDHHFNFDGHKIYTMRVLQTMKDKGWFPWQ